MGKSQWCVSFLSGIFNPLKLNLIIYSLFSIKTTPFIFMYSCKINRSKKLTLTNTYRDLVPFLFCCVQLSQITSRSGFIKDLSVNCF